LKKKHLRSALFWEIVQRMAVIPYWRFGTSYRLTIEDGTDRLSRNVGKKLPLHNE